MRISDWSSDVCSSDLDPLAGAPPASATATASNSLSADARSPPSGSSCPSNWMLRRPNPSPLPPLSFTQAYGLSVTKRQRQGYVSLSSSTFWPCAFSSTGFCFDLVRISTVPSGTTPSWPFSHALRRSEEHQSELH